MSEQAVNNPQTEDLLWRRVAYGLVLGFLVAGVLGYILISAARPDQEQASRIGLAAYLAFWSGPFVGLSAAVGYHELKKHHAPEASTSVERPEPAEGRMDTMAA